MQERIGLPEASPEKKPYQEPKLRVYGDLTSITGTIAVAGVPDGNNKGSVHKTA